MAWMKGNGHERGAVAHRDQDVLGRRSPRIHAVPRAEIISPRIARRSGALSLPNFMIGKRTTPATADERGGLPVDSTTIAPLLEPR